MYHKLKKKKTAFTFGLLVLFIIAISVLGIYSLNTQKEHYVELYGKQLAEKALVLDANSRLIMVHRALQDVTMSRDKESLNLSIVDFEKNNKVFLDLMNKAKLTNKDDSSLINVIIDKYNEFTSLRKSAVDYAYNEEYDSASNLTKTLATKQVDDILFSMRYLIEIIEQKTVDSLAASDKNVRFNIFMFIMLSWLTCSIAILLSYIVAKSLAKADFALFHEKENLRVTLNSIGDGVITTDTEQRIQIINKVAQNLTGWSKNEAKDKLFTQVFKITHEELNGIINNPVEEVLRKDTICELSNHAVLHSKDGRLLNVADSAAPIKDENGITKGVVMVFRDVSEEKERQNRIQYLSYHDGLTGLYNRAYYELQIQKLNESKTFPVSIIIGDLNGLKLMNDVYGHIIGDELLKRISAILFSCVKDKGTPTRWGGDEFTVLLPNTSEEEAEQICNAIKQKCLEQSKEPFILSISLGVATKKDANTDLHEVLKEAEDRMYTHKLIEGKSVRSIIISSLRKTLSEKSGEAEEHCGRMLEYLLKLTDKLDLSPTELDQMKLFTLLHDIGKIGIPDAILNKPDKLNDDEWIIMKKHCEIGYRIALSTYELANIADLILTHHEKWDGSGYPQGLKGESIPKLSRILSIIDAYDAMTSDRPYRNAMTHKAAVEEIERCKGKHFDPILVDVFINTL